ncbi:MAG: class I SAM-dependent methyltransferase [Methylomonas sp.]
MSPDRPYTAWNRLLSESLRAMRGQRFSEAAALLRPIVGGDVRKAGLWPNYKQALTVYAGALYQCGEIRAALTYQTKLLNLAPGDLEARGNFLLLLKAGEAHLPDSAEFRRLLPTVLEQTDIGEYALVCAQALLKDAGFAEAFRLILNGAPPEPIFKALNQGRLRALMQAPLLLLLLRRALIPAPAFETVFRKLRKLLLLAYAQPGASARPGKPELEFIGALAHYVWLTEYAICEDEQETAIVNGLRQELDKEWNLPLSAERQTTLAYFALYRCGLELADCEILLWQAAAGWKSFLQPLALEWQGRLQERRLAAQIESLTPIAAGVSELVRRQYEENPFPRWKHDPAALRRTSAGWWLAGFAPGLRPPAGFDGPIDVLTAGCGTGLEPISLVRQIETRRYLAVDLSRASLAYARLMARRLGLESSIDFAQADITLLGGCAERFDLITASGVLHHLREPLAGWRILAGLLKPGGVMLVSLYSASARQTVNRARQLIAEQAWTAEPSVMRRLRQAVLAGEFEELKSLQQWRDFYNLSMFRDLVFHVNEHQYSIPLIERQLNELGLQFVCMRGLPAPLQARYRADFPDDPQSGSLANWANFEERHPTAFISMYGLVLQKPT